MRARYVLSILLLGWIACGARSGTTQPSTTAVSWVDIVRSFAQAITNRSDEAAVDSLVREDVIVRRFTRPSRADLTLLRAWSAGTRAISIRYYSGVPTTLATDVAADFRDSTLSEPVKNRMTPLDSEAKNANAMAAKWVTNVLRPNPDQPVGVIVLWPEDTKGDGTGAADSSADAGSATFILVKGEAIGDRFLINHICYGDPLQYAGE